MLSFPRQSNNRKEVLVHRFLQNPLSEDSNYDDDDDDDDDYDDIYIYFISYGN